MNAGDSKNVIVEFSGDKTDNVVVTFTAPSANGNITIKSVPDGVGCDSPGGTTVTCTGVDVPQAGTKSLTFILQAKSPSTLQPGTNLNDQTGSVSGGGASGSFKVNLKGPAQTAPAATTVTEVSGTVTDSTTAKGVKGAAVVMQDGAGKSRQATTDDAGRFRFLGTETNPIAPGGIQITVTVNGYDAGSKDVTGAAGKPNTGIKIPIVPIGSTASPVAPPPNEESTPAGPAPQSAAPGAGNTSNTASDSGGSGFSSYILIALGALLVIFGIVAIVLLLRRRGDDDDDEELDEDPGPRRGGGAQRPGYRQPQADPTMVGAMGGPPTMINRGAANDATAIVRPGRANDYDVPPDPYGAPLPRAGSGYGAAGAAGAGAGYGAANGGGYNDQAGYAQGAPSAGAGYGPSSRPAVDPYGPEYGAGGGNGFNDQVGGYGAGAGGGAQGGGYADSTQRWEPSAGNGYAGGQSGAGNGYGAGGGANGYGAEPAPSGYGAGQGGGAYNGGGANGYGADPGGYGPASGAGAGGYVPSAGQGGYAPGGAANDGYPSAGGGYAPSAGNGYNGAPADYDGPYAGRGGYEQRGGYEPAAGQRGGYEPAAGYERDGYERVPEPPRAGSGYGDQPAGNDNYEQRGGYGDPQGTPRGAAGPSRRSLDWLDD